MRRKLGGIGSLVLALVIIFSYQNCSPVHEGDFAKWNEEASTGFPPGTDPGMEPPADLGPATFANVYTVLQSYCISCHSSGGTASQYPLTSYEDVMNYVEMSGGASLGMIYEEVASGSMPQNPVTMPSSVREGFLDLLFDWITSGAPNN